MQLPTVTSAGVTRASGWALQRGSLRQCAGGCGLFVTGTMDYVAGPVYCLYCDQCRPGPHCGCDQCGETFPLNIPPGEPF